MKKLYDSNLFWVLIGILIGAVACYTILNFSMKEMAPADIRQHDDFDGVMIASVSTDDRFLYEPSESFPVPERFSIQFEYQDPGMLITDFPADSTKETITL